MGFPGFYNVMVTLMKVWENSKQMWKPQLFSCSQTLNFHSSYHSYMETRKLLIIIIHNYFFIWILWQWFSFLHTHRTLKTIRRMQSVFVVICRFLWGFVVLRFLHANFQKKECLVLNINNLFFNYGLSPRQHLMICSINYMKYLYGTNFGQQC